MPDHSPGQGKRSSTRCPRAPSFLGGGRPPPLEEAWPQGSTARHGVSTETLVLDVPVLRMLEEDPPLDHDLILALLEPWAEQNCRKRREARRKSKKRRKKKLPKASSGYGRPCDHAAQALAVFAAREREGAPDSVHRQTLDLPVAPQRQFRTVQTVQEIGDSTLQRARRRNDWCWGWSRQCRTWRLHSCLVST